MLRLAGLAVDLDLRGGPLPAWLRPFESQGAPELALSVELIAGPIPNGPPLSVRRENERSVVSGGGLQGWLGAREGALRVQGGDEALHAAVRLACAVWGIDRGVLLLHAACAVEAAGARVFAGPSGAGKTTMARLLAGHDPAARILSDEVTAVDADGLVHGHPFRSALGDGAPGLMAPLASLSLLEHGARTQAFAIAPSEAARALLPRIFLPLRDPRSLRAALGAVASLVERVPVRRLAFVPDASAVAA